MVVTETFTWHSNSGESIVLNDGLIYDVRFPVIGRLWPEYDFVSDERYLQAGEKIKLVKVKPRRLSVPMTVYGANASDRQANLRILEDAFDPLRGIGRLEIVTVDSLSRNLDCFCDSWDAPEDIDYGSAAGTFFIFPVTFRAPYPFWYNATPNSQFWDSGTGWDPIDVSYAGNVDSYPVWTITAATNNLTTLTIINNTTGEEMHFDPADTGTFMITTQPGSESIIKYPSTNYAGYLDVVNTTSLFPFERGINNIDIDYTGTPTITVTASWYSFYKGI